ncbi:hypothetical protein LEP1GSC058_0896 [Leptospira fainei serovar Hurstbridge str. BUT 6]|uniref:Activator of Hsp90 ATPase homologue 1/2-like C-terminal domain-containing protein n=1 Tax=Leptospira fainei serovar Hurstbridge str. BUT 6 TaxID=1193011 RepID=S3UW47_9LEPT|nr:SRPBCC domain-containing protein [Leptospira fainei]EPG72549.1 hypothetical protein LEP1GSC058_0896 [Leptospira fainei serovar Hurstbridge str. BUT 6]
MGNDGELLITRIFDAPREIIFKLWTNPEYTKQWMGPREHPAVYVEQDLRPGGVWRTCLRAVDGSGDLWQNGVYHEIKEPEKLVFTFVWEGDNDLPHKENLVTIIFSEHEGKTKMIFKQSVFESVTQRDGHQYGWNSSFDRLVEHLARVSKSD